ncbi:hypothetical protein pb186bvf_001020 [Paramecium bursaria]
MSHYEILGLKRDANTIQIKKAYHKMALQWHPDKNNEQRPVALEKFNRINEAYQTLSKANSKLLYDIKLSEQNSLKELYEYLTKNDEESEYVFDDYLTAEEKELLNKFTQKSSEPLKKRIRKR